jgi:hypothetical protein
MAVVDWKRLPLDYADRYSKHINSEISIQSNSSNGGRKAEDTFSRNSNSYQDNFTYPAWVFEDD